MELSSLIDKLEEAINSGTGLPVGRVMVERDKISDLLMQIRAAIPTDVQEAQDLLGMRQNLIDQALVETRRIKTSAEEDARNRVKDSEITKEAKTQAEEIVTAAQGKAQRILEEAASQADATKQDADRYAHSALQKLEHEVTTLLETVRGGIELLDAKKEPSV